jgi:hypothetical protein
MVIKLWSITLAETQIFFWPNRGADISFYFCEKFKRKCCIWNFCIFLNQNIAPENNEFFCFIIPIKRVSA